MAAVILFGDLIWRRAAEWAIYPDAARGYLAGEQDPAEDAGVGLLTVNTVPSGREIDVRHRLTRTLVATTFSAADGTWQVLDLPALDSYDIIARDYAGVYEDVIVGDQLPYVPV